MARNLIAMIAAATLMTAQTAFADDAAIPAPVPPPTQTGPLAPGPAAGVHAAEDGQSMNGVVIGAAIILAAVGIYFIVGTNYHNPESKSSSGKK